MKLDSVLRAEPLTFIIKPSRMLAFWDLAGIFTTLLELNWISELSVLDQNAWNWVGSSGSSQWSGTLILKSNVIRQHAWELAQKKRANFPRMLTIVDDSDKCPIEFRKFFWYEIFRYWDRFFPFWSEIPRSKRSAHEPNVRLLFLPVQLVRLHRIIFGWIINSIHTIVCVVLF